jgi:hypothetical protein
MEANNHSEGDHDYENSYSGSAARIQGRRHLAMGSLIPLSASAAMSAPATSGSSGARFGWVLAGGGDFGGDDVATVSFENGDTQDVKAGQGLWVGVGGYYKPEYLSPYSIRATVGFKYTTTKASNADINLSRVPLELIGSYQFPNGTRLGAGPVPNTNVKLDGDGYFEDVDFDDATGSGSRPAGNGSWSATQISTTKPRTSTTRLMPAASASLSSASSDRHR